MQHSLVMTVIGKDRPGLVDSIASLVAEHGGNWLESRMSRLGGQFARIVQVEVAAEKERSPTNAAQRLDARGLTVVARSDQKFVATSQQTNIPELVGEKRPVVLL